jgi:hypothetical protein
MTHFTGSGEPGRYVIRVIRPVVVGHMAAGTYIRGVVVIAIMA